MKGDLAVNRNHGPTNAGWVERGGGVGRAEGAGPGAAKPLPRAPATKVVLSPSRLAVRPVGTAWRSSLGLTAKRFAVEGEKVGQSTSTSVPEVDVPAIRRVSIATSGDAESRLAIGPFEAWRENTTLLLVNASTSIPEVDI